MRRIIPNCLLGIAAIAPVPALAQVEGPVEPAGKWTAHDPGGAQTPPMGWSSWNAFRTEITEEKLLASADALVRNGLAAKGYRQINIDDGWWLKRRQSDGRLVVRMEIFPSAVPQLPGGDTSLRPLTDRLHAMGLKAGIYTDLGRNACSQAYDLHSPNLPEGSTAEREVGLAGHVDQDITLFFRDWNFDYVKVDACGLADYAADKDYVAKQGYRPESPIVVRGNPALTDENRVRDLYREVGEAIRRIKPDGVLSVCVWGQADVRAWGKDVGNLWRTSEDITPSWTSMLQSFDSTAGRELYAQPGGWNDPDMLFIGSGDFDADYLVQARSHFSLWAIMNAPLIIGYDLRSAPQPLLDILGNPAVIAINQDSAGNQGGIAYRSADLTIIVKLLADGRKAVALLNRTASPIEADLTAAHLKMSDEGEITMTDVWNDGKDLRFTGTDRIALAPHETRLFLATGKRVLENGVYLSEIPGSVNVAADGVRRSELDPTIHRGISEWSGSSSSGEWPIYSGWGGAQSDASPHGTPLSIVGQGFASGIGIYSSSRLEVRADGKFSRFSAEVGVDDSSRNQKDPVMFEVYGDGRLLASSPQIYFGEEAVSLKADVTGVNVIELVVRDGIDEHSPVSTVWGSVALKYRR